MDVVVYLSLEFPYFDRKSKNIEHSSILGSKIGLAVSQKSRET